jgi:hypothetical protein
LTKILNSYRLYGQLYFDNLIIFSTQTTSKEAQMLRIATFLCLLALPGFSLADMPIFRINDTSAVKTESGWQIISYSSVTRTCSEANHSKTINIIESFDTICPLAVENGISDSLVLLAVSQKKPIITGEEKIITHSGHAFLTEKTIIKTFKIVFDQAEGKVKKEVVPTLLKINKDKRIIGLSLLILLLVILVVVFREGKIIFYNIPSIAITILVILCYISQIVHFSEIHRLGIFFECHLITLFIASAILLYLAFMNDANLMMVSLALIVELSAVISLIVGKYVAIYQYLGFSIVILIILLFIASTLQVNITLKKPKIRKKII